jgi:hypothetical protein
MRVRHGRTDGLPGPAKTIHPPWNKARKEPVGFAGWGAPTRVRDALRDSRGVPAPTIPAEPMTPVDRAPPRRRPLPSWNRRRPRGSDLHGHSTPRRSSPAPDPRADEVLGRSCGSPPREAPAAALSGAWRSPCPSGGPKVAPRARDGRPDHPTRRRPCPVPEERERRIRSVRLHLRAGGPLELTSRYGSCISRVSPECGQSARKALSPSVSRRSNGSPLRHQTAE